ncbi:hypothetical protein J6590_054984 [Homalodisca vitripennis]|nr:hypothetical protein J6590_054984 [Homalodisca vitripennis]
MAVPLEVCVLFTFFVTLSQSITSGDWSPSGSVSSTFPHHSHEDDSETYYTTAYINVTFVDPISGRTVREKTEIGKFGESHIGFSSGVLVHVRSGADNSGCSLPFKSSSGSGELPKEPWIALVKRGGCNFQVKVDNAYSSNASGVIVYNDRDSTELEKMKLTLKVKKGNLFLFIDDQVSQAMRVSDELEEVEFVQKTMVQFFISLPHGLYKNTGAEIATVSSEESRVKKCFCRGQFLPISW